MANTYCIRGDTLAEIPLTKKISTIWAWRGPRPYDLSADANTVWARRPKCFIPLQVCMTVTSFLGRAVLVGSPCRHILFCNYLLTISHLGLYWKKSIKSEIATQNKTEKWCIMTILRWQFLFKNHKYHGNSNQISEKENYVLKFMKSHTLNHDQIKHPTGNFISQI